MTPEKKMMDLLAKRDHTEKELRQKLETRFSAAAIEAAVSRAKKARLIPHSSEELQRFASKTAEAYLRQGKSPLWIEAKCESLGLPIPNTHDNEDLGGAIKAAQIFIRRKTRSGSYSKKELLSHLSKKGFKSGTLRGEEFSRLLQSAIDSANQE